MSPWLSFAAFNDRSTVSLQVAAADKIATAKVVAVVLLFQTERKSGVHELGTILGELALRARAKGFGTGGRSGGAGCHFHAGFR